MLDFELDVKVRCNGKVSGLSVRIRSTSDFVDCKEFIAMFFGPQMFDWDSNLNLDLLVNVCFSGFMLN